MPTALAARLDWLEAKIPDEKRSRRVICVVASAMEEATEFARSLGYDPNSEDDFLIVNRIVGDGYTAPYLRSANERNRWLNALAVKFDKLEAR